MTANIKAIAATAFFCLTLCACGDSNDDPDPIPHPGTDNHNGATPTETEAEKAQKSIAYYSAVPADFKEQNSAARALGLNGVVDFKNTRGIKRDVSGKLQADELPQGRTQILDRDNNRILSLFNSPYVTRLGVFNRETAGENVIHEFFFTKIAGASTKSQILNEEARNNAVITYTGSADAIHSASNVDQGEFKYTIHMGSHTGEGEITGIKEIGVAARDAKDDSKVVAQAEGKPAYVKGIDKIVLTKTQFPNSFFTHPLFVSGVSEDAIKMIGAAPDNSVAKLLDASGQEIPSDLRYVLGLFGPELNAVAGAVLEKGSNGKHEFAGVSFAGVRSSGKQSDGSAPAGGTESGSASDGPAPAVSEELKQAKTAEIDEISQIGTGEKALSVSGKFPYSDLKAKNFAMFTGRDGAGMLYSAPYSVLAGMLNREKQGENFAYDHEVKSVFGLTTAQEDMSKLAHDQAVLRYTGKAWSLNGPKTSAGINLNGVLNYTLDFHDLTGQGEITGIDDFGGAVRDADHKIVNEKPASGLANHVTNVEKIVLENAHFGNEGVKNPLYFNPAKPGAKVFGVEKGGAKATAYGKDGSRIAEDMRYDLALFGHKAEEITGVVYQKSAGGDFDKGTIGFNGSAQ